MECDQYKSLYENHKKCCIDIDRFYKHAFKCISDIEIPFQNDRIAVIAYDALRVDKEPKRSGVVKILSVKENILTVKFKAQLARQLRVAVNGFLEKLDLVSETIEIFGPAVSDSYSYY